MNWEPSVYKEAQTLNKITSSWTAAERTHTHRASKEQCDKHRISTRTLEIREGKMKFAAALMIVWCSVTAHGYRMMMANPHVRHCQAITVPYCSGSGFGKKLNLNWKCLRICMDEPYIPLTYIFNWRLNNSLISYSSNISYSFLFIFI